MGFDALTWTVWSVLAVTVAAATYNSCLLNDKALTPPTKSAPQTFLKECPAWVIRTTDKVWNQPYDAATNTSLEEYFYEDWTSTSTWGAVKRGMGALKDLVASTRRAFPDLKIHITDVFCYGNDIDGYKTVMPDVLTGTNLGPSSYGPATGKKVKYSGTAVCFVQKVKGRWQYVAEWLLHDEVSVLAQLGVDSQHLAHPNTTAEPHDCKVNTPGFGWHAPGDQSLSAAHGSLTGGDIQGMRIWDPNDPLFEGEPVAKAVIKAMDKTISDHVDWNNWPQWEAVQRPFWVVNMTYDTVYTPNGILGNSTGLRQWYDHEHIPFNLAFKTCDFNQMIFAADDTTATTTTYGLAKWQGDFATIPHTGKVATIRICDFYRMEGHRIAYNWMMLDMVDLMLQAGYRVLPKAPLREQWVQVPRAMDGIPAPLTEATNVEEAKFAKDLVLQALHTEWLMQNSSGSLWNSDMIWYGPVGFGVANGVAEYVKYFLQPLHAAFVRPELNVDVVSCQGNFCGAHGHFYGTHVGEWLGEKATGKRVTLRFGMHWHVDTKARKFKEGYAMFDIPLAFKSLGVDLYARMHKVKLAT